MSSSSITNRFDSFVERYSKTYDSSSEYDLRSNVSSSSITIRNRFDSFVERYSKIYDSSSEYDLRSNVFRKNLERIEELNLEHKDLATFGVNEFSDLTFEEFSKKRLSSYISSRPVRLETKTTVLDASSVDWRNVTTPVRKKNRRFLFSRLHDQIQSMLGTRSRNLRIMLGDKCD